MTDMTNPNSTLIQGEIPQNYHTFLVGGFNPFEKYARQFGSSPQVGVKRKKYLKPPPRFALFDDPLYINGQFKDPCSILRGSGYLVTGYM